MPHNPPHPQAAPPLPTTIWLPPADRPDTAPAPDRVLPTWTQQKIRTEYTRRHGHPPAPLTTIQILDTGPGTDARTPCTTDTDTDTNTGPDDDNNSLPQLTTSPERTGL